MQFKVWQKVKVFWLCGIECLQPEGVVVKVRSSFVTVEFDREPGGGFDRVQKFTLRKSGEFVAAGWHWASGVPGLRAK